MGMVCLINIHIKKEKNLVGFPGKILTTLFQNSKIVYKTKINMKFEAEKSLVFPVNN